MGAVRLFAAALALLACAARADPIEDFYRGRQVRAVIGNEAGGDYDQWARLILRYMGRYLPGNPVFVVQNMPGAGQIIAANHLYNSAERDGSVIGMIGRNLPYLALLKEPNVRFDPRGFHYLGSPELSGRVCVAMEGAGVRGAEDLFERELITGGAGAGTAVTATPNLLRRLLGMRFKVVEGYGSAANVMLAMERGEAQGICQTLAALRATRAGWMESGRLKVLFNLEREPAPGLDAPSILAFAKTDEQRRILSLFNSSVELGRPMVAPPGVPPARIAALRMAFAGALGDPDLRAEAARLRFEITHVSGERLAGLVADLMETPDETVRKTAELAR